MKDMTYEEMKLKLDNYNWDDGFSFPKEIIASSNCDLALALEVFYLADGYSYLMDIEQAESSNKDWYSFTTKLYNDILGGVYEKTNNKFEIPLSKVQCYKLKNKMIDEVFLTSL